MYEFVCVGDGGHKHLVYRTENINFTNVSLLIISNIIIQHCNQYKIIEISYFFCFTKSLKSGVYFLLMVHLISDEPHSSCVAQPLHWITWLQRIAALPTDVPHFCPQRELKKCQRALLAGLSKENKYFFLHKVRFYYINTSVCFPVCEKSPCSGFAELQRTLVKSSRGSLCRDRKVPY